MKAILFLKDSKITRFMQAADVFERFKIIAHPWEIDLDESKTNLIKFREGWTDEDSPIVAIFTPGSTEGAWKDDSVKVISDGNKWVTFDQWLTIHGWVGGAP